MGNYNLLAVSESSPNHCTCAALPACLFQNEAMFLLKIMLTKKMSRAHSLLCYVTYDEPLLSGTTSINYKRPIFGYEEKKKNTPRPQPLPRVFVLLTTAFLAVKPRVFSLAVWPIRVAVPTPRKYLEYLGQSPASSWLDLTMKIIVVHIIFSSQF